MVPFVLYSLGSFEDILYVRKEKGREVSSFTLLRRGLSVGRFTDVLYVDKSEVIEVYPFLGTVPIVQFYLVLYSIHIDTLKIWILVRWVLLINNREN